MAERTSIDAQIKDIKVTPAHFNKHREIDRDEFATLTLKVPMDSEESKVWVTNLFRYLSREYVAVDIASMQTDLPGIEAKSSTQSVSLSAEDVEKQLEVAKEAAD